MNRSLFRFILVWLVLLVIQSAAGLVSSFPRPDLPGILTVFAALRYGPAGGAMTGLASGWAMESLGIMPPGISMLVRMLTGLAAGGLRHAIRMETMRERFAAIGSAEVFQCLLTAFVLRISGHESSSSRFVHVLAVQPALTALTALFLLPLLMRILRPHILMKA